METSLVTASIWVQSQNNIARMQKAAYADL